MLEEVSVCSSLKASKDGYDARQLNLAIGQTKCKLPDMFDPLPFIRQSSFGTILNKHTGKLEYQLKIGNICKLGLDKML